MRAKELIKSIGCHCLPADLKDFEVKGISCNSKQVSDNFIFVAIEGTRIDGHKFIDEAIERGARAVVVTSHPSNTLGAGKSEVRSHGKAAIIQTEDARKALAKLAASFYEEPSKKIKVVGVTGTNGKTTITYLLESLLKEAGFQPAVIGTVNYRFRDKIIPSGNTTPGPLELQSLLSDMVNGGASHAVIEVSSHALSQDRTEAINFDSAIFTNLTQDHLDYHGTIEDYFQAKAKLFKGLGLNSFVVINNDDKFGKRIIEFTHSPEIITYGIEEEADITASDIKIDISHTEFTLNAFKEKMNFKIKLIGSHNIYNVLASLAWAFKEGIDKTVIKCALENFNFIPGRLERISCEKDFSVFVDYAHTEDALNNVIRALKQISRGRIIVVFGCGGERDKTKRPKMGRIVTELADYTIITNDNPRSEDPGEIIKDILKGIEKDNYCIIPERKDAIKKSLSMAQRGDVLLIAGKGHENYQILNDKRIHFDDREVVRECLSHCAKSLD